MKSIENEVSEPDKVVDVRQAEIEKKQKLIGRITPKRGHTVWEIDLVNKTIEPAKFDDAIQPFKEKPKPKGFGYIHNQKGDKKIVLDGLQPIKRKLIQKPNCIYISALNKKNVIKILNRI